MSVISSEENYKSAKKLYQTISENFYSIENKDVDDEDFLMNQTLDYTKQLNKLVSKINLDELSDKYNVETMDAIESNIETFKESSYYIERSISSMLLFNKLNPILGPYMKRVNWNMIGISEEDAAKKFGAFLTNENNYLDYKSIINSIIKGTIPARSFKKLFDSIASRLPKIKRESSNQQSQKPPEMWDKTKQKEWDMHKKSRKKEAIKGNVEMGETTFGFTENFIGFNDYKKLFESSAFYCGTCDERAEHEEIEDNPRLKCPNCGDSNWEDEYERDNRYEDDEY